MFFLAGPTAVGKSGLAVEVALLCNAEIVSADAFQVYQGLDLLTAKPAPHSLARVPHHLVGEIPLDQKFDVAQYRQLAVDRIREIESRKKRALVVGGTGLYIRALTHGLSDLPAPNPALRQELDVTPLPELQQRYAALDPHGITLIDPQNRRRLVRAIEVSLLARAPFSSLRADWAGAKPLPAASGVILERTRSELYARIDTRVRQMFSQGVIDEVRAAAAGPTAAHAIGYGEIKAHLRGETTLDQCVTAIQQRTRRYAKRQLTWLRREDTFHTINLTDKPQSHQSPQNQLADAIARRIVAGYSQAADGGQIDS